MRRRAALRGLGGGVAAAAVVGAGVLATTGRPADASIPGGGTLTNQGVGMYTDPSVAAQMSTFTINPTMVSCGVGTFGLAGMTGPFSMIMFSVQIATYDSDPASGTIVATGRMRSITMIVLGVVRETVEHDFVAIAVDHRGRGPDRFDIHFVTSFWNRANPLATPSEEVPGWVRFGGDVATGLVLLNPTQLGGVKVPADRDEALR